MGLNLQGPLTTLRPLPDHNGCTQHCQIKVHYGAEVEHSSLIGSGVKITLCAAQHSLLCDLDKCNYQDYMPLGPAPSMLTIVEALAAAVAAASAACMTVDRGASALPEQASTAGMAMSILPWTSSTSGSTSTSALECGTSWRCLTACHSAHHHRSE